MLITVEVWNSDAGDVFKDAAYQAKGDAHNELNESQTLDSCGKNGSLRVSH